MPDIVTSKTFVDGEKGITAAKLNQIISGAVIQPSFVSSKPASSTLDPTDQLLELKGTGAYATITGQQLIDSVSTGLTQNIDPAIWSVRLRSYNAVSNPGFEYDARTSGLNLGNAPSGTWVSDRWRLGHAGSLAVTTQNQSGVVLVPGTSFAITKRRLMIYLATSQSTLGPADYLAVSQVIEGSRFREISADASSLSVLVQGPPNLKFSIAIQSPDQTQSLVKLCTITAGGSWQLFTLPNIPPPGAGNFSTDPGQAGYVLYVTLACGATLTAAAADTWQAANVIGAPNMSNFANLAVGTQFLVAFVQHEPGVQCSTLLDCPFAEAALDAERYFQKSWDYGVGLGGITANGSIVVPQLSTTALGGLQFRRSLAKTPTFTVYNIANGTTNSFQHTNGSYYVVTGNFGVGQNGVQAIGTGTLPAVIAGAGGYLHYTVDTGW